MVEAVFATDQTFQEIKQETLKWKEYLYSKMNMTARQSWSCTIILDSQNLNKVKEKEKSHVLVNYSRVHDHEFSF